MLILFLYTDVRILSLFDHVDCDNKLLTYITYLFTLFILMISEYIVESESHFLAITETWLSDNDQASTNEITPK